MKWHGPKVALLPIIALAVVVATLTLENEAYAQAADSVTIGTAELGRGETGKEIPIDVTNLTGGSGDQGMGVLTFEFVWDKRVIDVVGFNSLIDLNEYNVLANLIASAEIGEFLPPPFGTDTGRGIVFVDWASVPPPDALSGTFTVGNLVVDAAAGVTGGESTPIRLAVTEFVTNLDAIDIQGFEINDGRVDILEAITVGIPMGIGFNLIGIPVILETPLTASGLAANLENQGATVDTIRAFSGGFVSWNPLQPVLNDFDIENGDGYFVQLAGEPTSGIFQITGPPIVAPLSIDLGVGFNLVNFPVTNGPLTASTLAEEIKTAVDAQAQVSNVVDTIRAFSGGFISWNPLQAGLNDFNIDSNAAYFVQLSQAAPGFTPQGGGAQGAQVANQPLGSSSRPCRGTHGIVDYLRFNGPLQFLLPLPCVNEALGLDGS